MKSFLFIIFLFYGCEITSTKDDNVIASVLDKTITIDEVEKLVPDGTNKIDSIKIIKKYIEDWALNELLIEKAKLNLSENEIEKFRTLSENYYNELLTSYYKNKLSNINSDTIVKSSEVDEYYNNFKSNFKLNEDIVKGKYIKLSRNNFNLSEIKRRFKRFDLDDKYFFDSISIQLYNYSFNDSMWVEKNLFFSKIPILDEKEKNNIVKNLLYMPKEDSLDVYLLKISESKSVNDIAPLDYIYSRIESILKKKKKVDFIKKFEKEILENAKKENKFQFDQ